MEVGITDYEDVGGESSEPWETQTGVMALQEPKLRGHLQVDCGLLREFPDYEELLS